MNFWTKSKNSRKRYRDVYNFGVQKRCNCVKKHTRKHHPALSLPLNYKQNQCEIFEILSSKLIGSMWNSMKNERHLKPIASWKRSNVHAKTCKNAEIPENRRKPSMNTSQKSTKNRARPGCTLQRNALNRADRTIQIHENERIWNQFASWKRSEPCAKIAKSVEIRQNRWKSSMSTLQKSSKNRVSSTSRWYFPK